MVLERWETEDEPHPAVRASRPLAAAWLDTLALRCTPDVPRKVPCLAGMHFGGVSPHGSWLLEQKEQVGGGDRRQK